MIFALPTMIETFVYFAMKVILKIKEQINVKF